MEKDELGAECEAEDTTEELIAEYGRKRRRRPDDVIATQTVICILLAALFFGANFVYPDLTGAVFARIQGLATDSSSVIPNPIDLLISCIDKL